MCTDASIRSGRDTMVPKGKNRDGSEKTQFAIFAVIWPSKLYELGELC